MSWKTLFAAFICAGALAALPYRGVHASLRPAEVTATGPEKSNGSDNKKGDHEFYVGLTDMMYNAATRCYEVTIKVFTDDLELGLERAFGKKVLLSGTAPSVGHDELIFNYLSTHFYVNDKSGKAVELKPVGTETALDVTWIYLESAPMQPLQSAIVSNTMMMEVYKAQTHIFHITQSDRTRSALLHQKRKSDTISL